MPVDVSRAEEERVPVARLARPKPLVVTASDPEEPGEPFLTLEAVKGWASSLVLHGLLLLILAFWYFAPKPSPAKPIDTRLMGSEMGVEDGLSITGGLNTPLAIPEAIEVAPEPILTPIDLTPPELKASNKPEGAETPSAEGGMDSDNPGAGEGDGFGLAKFGQGGESILGVEVKVGDPQFTLIWDTEADLDLHVVEPGGKEIYWEEPRGRQGGELDVDNTKGYGPENIYWLQDADATGETKVKGAGPPGEYRWFVVYWGGFGGIVRPTRWKVRIKHDGKITVVTGGFKTLNERSRIYTLRVAPRGGLAAEVKDTH
jgi:hypothetical protein